MKTIIILHMLLSSGMVVVSSHKAAELPEEGFLKWNIDLSDMLRFTKSSLKDNVEEKVNDIPETIPVEDHVQILANQLKLVKKLNVLEDQAKQYIKRYINLFLVKCSLKDVPESDDDIEVDLTFSITKKDLIFLQTLSDDISLQKVQDNLQRLDAIFDKGLQLKEEGLVMKSWSLMWRIASYLRIPTSWYYSKIFYYIVVLAVTLALALYINYSGVSNALIVLIIINNFIILEGALDYLNKLEEAEIVDRVMFLKAQQSAVNPCDPSTRTMWSKITEWFSGDECLNYHMSFTKSKAQEVSPLKCILDAYDVYLFRYLFKITGSGIRVFSESLFESNTFGWLFVPISYIGILPFFLAVIVCLMKPNLRFRFFGTGLDVGFSNWNLMHRRNEMEAIQDRRIEEVQPIESEATEERHHSKGNGTTTDKPVESIGGECQARVVENEENRESLMEDIAAAREIVKDMKNNDGGKITKMKRKEEEEETGSDR